MSKRITVVVAASLLLMTWFATAQFPDNQMTLKAVNGRWWVAQNDITKTYFVVGYAEAWAFFAEGEFTKWFPAGIPYGEIVTGLNQFYAEPENLIIPMPQGIWLWTRKANVEDSAQWAESVASLRRYLRQVVSAPVGPTPAPSAPIKPPIQ